MTTPQYFEHNKYPRLEAPVSDLGHRFNHNAGLLGSVVGETDKEVKQTVTVISRLRALDTAMNQAAQKILVYILILAGLTIIAKFWGLRTEELLPWALKIAGIH